MSSAARSITFERRRGAATELWRVTDPLAKLALRGRLPGAFGFDRATEALNRARRAGVKAGDLLALAFPSSWLVNSAIPSPVLARWSLPPFSGYFRTLIAQLEIGVHEIAKLDEARIAGAVTPLAIEGQGAGAISKVVAPLVPGTMPLMPDAAIAFAIDAIAVPEAVDAQTATADLFAPMLKWFAQTTVEHEPALREIAAEDARARAPAELLEPAQVLDRLLWFESAGFRAMRGAIVGGGAYHFVGVGEKDARRRAIVRVPVDYAGNAKRADYIDLATEEEGAWKTAAMKALDEATAT